MEKLQNGDYCENLTKEQFEELIEIEGHQVTLLYEECEYYTLGFEYPIITTYPREKTKLSFEDFKQRCINTFKN